MEAEILAWLVPTAFAGLCAIFLTFRLNGSGSYWWVAAYGFAALGFVLTILPVGTWGVAKPVAEDTFFLIAFAALSSGLAERLQVPAGRALLVGLVAAGATGAFVALSLFESVPAEVFFVQTACALILMQSAYAMRRKLHQPIDRVLFGLCIAFAASLVLQNIAFLAAPDENLTIQNWRLSPWAFVFQTSGAITGILFAFAILIAIGMDIIASLQRVSTTDSLTGTLNRRGFQAQYGQVAAHQASTERGSVVIVDIDHFKSVNDAYGHEAGDAVICAMATLLVHFAGAGGHVGRMGGEEFAVLLPGVDLARARDLAEGIRKAFAETSWPAPLERLRVTASFGVTDIGPTESPAEAVERADRLLYLAKRNGRDRTCCGSHDGALDARPAGARLTVVPAAA